MPEQAMALCGKQNKCFYMNLQLTMIKDKRKSMPKQH